MLQIAARSCLTRLARSTMSSTKCLLHLDVNPRVSMMDDPVHIQVSGLTPDTHVTLATRLQEDGNTFVAHGHYTADGAGNVDLKSAPSVGGSYTGVEPVGLLWSLQPEVGSRIGVRVRQADVTQPHEITLAVIPEHVSICKGDDLDGGCALEKTKLERFYKSPDVKRIPIREDGLVATLFLPQNGSGRHPGILDLYGNTGGLIEYRAAMLASRGFATLALAYVGYENLPSDLTIDLRYFEKAINFLTSHPSVSPGGIGAIGISAGAEITLHLSQLCKEVKAITAIGASDARCMIEYQYKGSNKLPYKVVDYNDIEYKGDCVYIRPAIYKAKGSGAIPAGTIKSADVLFLYGTDDAWIDPRLVFSLITRMVESGGSNFSLHMYQGVGHLIEPPYIPFSPASWHKMFKMVFAWGGEILPTVRAQEDAWGKILNFFRERLPKSDLKSKL